MDDLNDSLDGLFGGPASETPRAPKTPPANFVPAIERLFTEGCQKCGGSGNWRPGYPCFTCKGTGKLQFKTSADQRAKAKGYADTKRVEKLQDQRAWREAHKVEITWLYNAAERQFERAHKGQKTWDFPIQLSEGLAQYGTLTEGQMEAVRKCMARDAERAAEYKAQAQARVAAAPEISVGKIEQAFATARASKLKWPKLHLGAFTFKPAGPTSKNPGAIYVTEGEEYLGKIVGGKFAAVRSCGPDREAKILAAAADPMKAAEAYGLMTGNCSCCGRELTNAESVGLGIGPICREKYGW